MEVLLMESFGALGWEEVPVWVHLAVQALGILILIVVALIARAVMNRLL